MPRLFLKLIIMASENKGVEMLRAKNRFEAALHNFIKEMSEIDKQTPWQEVEPEWWLDMSELQRHCNKIKKAIA